MITVVVADDQELVRSGLRMILEPEADIEVVGEAVDGAEAVTLVVDRSPDVLLLDVRMPGTDGIEAARAITEAGLQTRVLMLTTFDLDEYVFDALAAGATGFLLKDMAGEDIVTAVRQAARGAGALLAPTLTKRLVERFATRRPSVTTDPEVLASLTSRELDVLRLVADGRSNAEIAAALFIGETTVKTHVARLLMKLGVRDRVQAVIVAFHAGLVGPLR